MSYLKVVYFTVVLVSITWLSSGQGCIGELSNCFQNLRNMSQRVVEGAIAVMSDETVVANCRIYNDTKGCIREISDSCPLNVDYKEHWQVVEEEYEWLCVLAPQDYLENNECFQNKELISDTQECLQNFTRELRSYRIDESTCDIPNTYLNCVYGHVLRECGVNAAKWQKEYDIRAFEYLLKNYGCVRNGDEFVSEFLNEEECTPWIFDRCLSDFDIPEKKFIPLVVMTDEQVDKNCKVFERGKPCMEKIIDDCHAEVQGLWRTFDYLFIYLCEASKRQVYLRHNECFDNNTLHADTMKCYETYEAGIAGTITTTAQCQAKKDYINCTTNYILQYCGVEAAEWHRGYDIEVSKPLMEVIQCDLGGYVTPSPSPPSPSLTTSSPGVRQVPQYLQSGNSWHINIIAVIAIAVASIVVVLAVVILIVFIRRKSSPAPPGPATAAVPPPYIVAYSGHTNESYSVDISGYGSNVYSNAPALPLATKEPPPLIGETTTS